MGIPASSGKRDLCPRCRANVALDAKTCPGCGERLVSTRNFPIYVGIVGVLMLIFVAMVMVIAIRKEDEASKRGVSTLDAPSPEAGQVKPPPLNK